MEKQIIDSLNGILSLQEIKNFGKSFVIYETNELKVFLYSIPMEDEKYYLNNLSISEFLPELNCYYNFDENIEFDTEKKYSVIFLSIPTIYNEDKSIIYNSFREIIEIEEPWLIIDNNTKLPVVHSLIFFHDKTSFVDYHTEYEKSRINYFYDLNNTTSYTLIIMDEECEMKLISHGLGGYDFISRRQYYSLEIFLGMVKEEKNFNAFREAVTYFPKQLKKRNIKTIDDIPSHFITSYKTLLIDEDFEDYCFFGYEKKTNIRIYDVSDDLDIWDFGHMEYDELKDFLQNQFKAFYFLFLMNTTCFRGPPSRIIYVLKDLYEKDENFVLKAKSLGLNVRILINS